MSDTLTHSTQDTRQHSNFVTLADQAEASHATQDCHTDTNSPAVGLVKDLNSNTKYTILPQTSSGDPDTSESGSQTIENRCHNKLSNNYHTAAEKFYSRKDELQTFHFIVLPGSIQDNHEYDTPFIGVAKKDPPRSIYEPVHPRPRSLWKPRFKTDHTELIHSAEKRNRKHCSFSLYKNKCFTQESQIHPSTLVDVSKTSKKYGTWHSYSGYKRKRETGNQGRGQSCCTPRSHKIIDIATALRLKGVYTSKSDHSVLHNYSQPIKSKAEEVLNSSWSNLANPIPCLDSSNKGKTKSESLDFNTVFNETILSEEYLSRVVVNYNMDKKETYQHKKCSKSGDSSAERFSDDDCDQAYQCAFDFARAHGYGFVQFVEDRCSRATFHRRRSGATSRTLMRSPKKGDRVNPVCSFKSGPRPLRKHRNVCKSQKSKDDQFDYAPLYESVQQDIAMVKQVSDDLEAVYKSSKPLKKTASDPSKPGQPRKNSRRRNSPQRGSPKVPDDMNVSYNEENEIINSASLDRYVEYLSKKCEKACQEPVNRRAKARTDDDGGSSSNPEDARDSSDFSALYPTFVSQYKFLQEDSDAPIRTETNVGLERKSHKCVNIGQPSKETSKLKTNTLDSGASSSAGATFWTEEDGTCSSEAESILPRLTDKTSFEYKLCNSLSATIFREAQLAQKHFSRRDLSRNLPVTEIDVVHMRDEGSYSNDGDAFVEREIPALQQHHPSLSRKVKLLKSTGNDSPITRTRCLRKRSTYQDADAPETDISKQLDGDKPGSCPNLVVHNVSRKPKSKVADGHSPIQRRPGGQSSPIGDFSVAAQFVNQLPTSGRPPALGDGIAFEGEGETLKALGEDMNEGQTFELGNSMKSDLTNPKVTPRGTGMLLGMAASTKKCEFVRLSSYDDLSTLNTSDNKAVVASTNTDVNVKDSESSSQRGSDKEDVPNSLSKAAGSHSDENLSPEDIKNEDDIETSGNNNNNALPQVTPQPDKSRTISVARKDESCSPTKSVGKSQPQSETSQQKEQQRLRLPDLSRNRNVSAHSSSHAVTNLPKVNNDSSMMSTPQRKPESAHSPNENQHVQGKKARHGDSRNTETSRLPVLNGSEASLTKQERSTAGKSAMKHSKKKLSGHSPEKIKPPIITSTKVPDQTNKPSSLRCGKLESLNKSYVISRSDNNNNQDTDVQSGSSYCKPVICNIVSDHQNVLSRPVLPSTPQNSSNTKCSPEKIVSAKTNVFPRPVPPNIYDFIPKPKISARSPEFAVTRQGKEETRLGVCVMPSENMTNMSPHRIDMCSPDSLRNSNNNSKGNVNTKINGNKTVLKKTSACESFSTYTVIDCLSFHYSTSRITTKPSDSCTPHQLHFSTSRTDHNSNAVMSRDSLHGYQGNQQTQTNSNNHARCRLPTSSEASEGAVQAAASFGDIGSELESELQELVQECHRNNAFNIEEHLSNMNVYKSLNPTACPVCFQVNVNACDSQGQRRRLHERENAGRGLHWSQARHEHYARRRCLRASSAAASNGEERRDSSDSNSSGCENGQEHQHHQNGHNQESNQESRDLHQNILSNRYFQEHVNAPYQGDIPFCPTTENYWQTATQQPLAIQPFGPGHHGQTGDASHPPYQFRPVIRWPQDHASTASYMHGLTTQRPESDEPMENDNEEHSAACVRPPIDTLTEMDHEVKFIHLYRQLRELWEQSHRDVREQLESVSVSVNDRLDSLQNLVERKFQRTCSLIQNNVRNSTQGTKVCVEQGVEKMRKNADTIQLNTQRGTVKNPAYGFPLDISKYLKEDDKTQSKKSGNSKGEGKTSEVVKEGSEGSSGASVKTFPTIQFHEVTQESDKTLNYPLSFPSDSASASKLKESTELQTSNTNINEANPDKTKKDSKKSQKTKVTRTGTNSGRGRPVKRRQKKGSSNKVDDKTYSPRYKSIRLWRQEVNEPILLNPNREEKLENARYFRRRHSRSCRRRRGADGNIHCNTCLPYVKTVCRRGRKRKTERTGGARGILRNSGRPRRNRKKRAKRKMVRWKLAKQDGRRRRKKKKLHSPPLRTRPDDDMPLNEAIMLQNNHVLEKHTKRKESPRILTDGRLSSPASQTKKGQIRYALTARGKESLSNNARRRHRVSFDLPLCCSCNNSNSSHSSLCSDKQLEMLEDNFRKLIRLLPRKRLKTLTKILKLPKTTSHRGARKVLSLSERSPARSRPQLSQTLNNSTVPQRLQIGRPYSSRFKPMHNSIANNIDSTRVQRAKQQLGKPNGRATHKTQNALRNSSCVDNLNCMAHMYRRPGFYFFNTTFQPSNDNNVDIGRSGSEDSVQPTETGPGPVDSFTVTRNRLSKSKDKSKNACTFGTSTVNDCRLLMTGAEGQEMTTLVRKAGIHSPYDKQTQRDQNEATIVNFEHPSSEHVVIAESSSVEDLKEEVDCNEETFGSNNKYMTMSRPQTTGMKGRMWQNVTVGSLGRVGDRDRFQQWLKQQSTIGKNSTQSCVVTDNPIKETISFININAPSLEKRQEQQKYGTVSSSLSKHTGSNHGTVYSRNTGVFNPNLAYTDWGNSHSVTENSDLSFRQGVEPLDLTIKSDSHEESLPQAQDTNSFGNASKDINRRDKEENLAHDKDQDKKDGEPRGIAFPKSVFTNSLWKGFERAACSENEKIDNFPSVASRNNRHFAKNDSKDTPASISNSPASRPEVFSSKKKDCDKDCLKCHENVLSSGDDTVSNSTSQESSGSHTHIVSANVRMHIKDCETDEKTLHHVSILEKRMKMKSIQVDGQTTSGKNDSCKDETSTSTMASVAEVVHPTLVLRHCPERDLSLAYHQLQKNASKLDCSCPSCSHCPPFTEIDSSHDKRHISQKVDEQTETERINDVNATISTRSNFNSIDIVKTWLNSGDSVFKQCDTLKQTPCCLEHRLLDNEMCEMENATKGALTAHGSFSPTAYEERCKALPPGSTLPEDLSAITNHECEESPAVGENFLTNGQVPKSEPGTSDVDRETSCEHTEEAEQSSDPMESGDVSGDDVLGQEGQDMTAATTAGHDLFQFSPDLLTRTQVPDWSFTCPFTVHRNVNSSVSDQQMDTNTANCRWTFEQPHLVVNPPGICTTWITVVPQEFSSTAWSNNNSRHAQVDESGATQSQMEFDLNNSEQRDRENGNVTIDENGYANVSRPGTSSDNVDMEANYNTSNSLKDRIITTESPSSTEKFADGTPDAIEEETFRNDDSTPARNQNNDVHGYATQENSHAELSGHGLFSNAISTIVNGKDIETGSEKIASNIEISPTVSPLETNAQSVGNSILYAASAFDEGNTIKHFTVNAFASSRQELHEREERESPACVNDQNIQTAEMINIGLHNYSSSNGSTTSTNPDFQKPSGTNEGDGHHETRNSFSHMSSFHVAMASSCSNGLTSTTTTTTTTKSSQYNNNAIGQQAECSTSYRAGNVPRKSWSVQNSSPKPTDDNSDLPEVNQSFRWNQAYKRFSLGQRDRGASTSTANDKSPSPLIQHLQNVTVSSSRCARVHSCTSNVFSFKVGLNSHQSGTSVRSNAPPPRKVRKLGHPFSLSQFLSSRRERLVMRRARWQVVRELRYVRLKERRHIRAGGSSTCFTQTLVREDKHSSDADSESSL